MGLTLGTSSGYALALLHPMVVLGALSGFGTKTGALGIKDTTFFGPLGRRSRSRAEPRLRGCALRDLQSIFCPALRGRFHIVT